LHKSLVSLAAVAATIAATFGPPVLPAAAQRAVNAEAAIDRTEADVLAAAQAKLAWALIEKLANRTGTITVSPASLASAFGIIGLGADPAMKAAVAETLGFAPERAEAGLAALADVRGKLTNDGDIFQSANRIVFAPSIPPNKILRAGPENLGIDYAVEDLSNPQAAAKIDAWVKAPASEPRPGTQQRLMGDVGHDLAVCHVLAGHYESPPMIGETARQRPLCLGTFLSSCLAANGLAHRRDRGMPRRDMYCPCCKMTRPINTEMRRSQISYA
jgi:hypothetical protein